MVKDAEVSVLTSTLPEVTLTWDDNFRVSMFQPPPPGPSCTEKSRALLVKERIHTTWGWARIFESLTRPYCHRVPGQAHTNMLTWTPIPALGEKKGSSPALLIHRNSDPSMPGTEKPVAQHWGGREKS